MLCACELHRDRAERLATLASGARRPRRSSAPMDAAKSVSGDKALRTMGHRVALGVVFVRHREQAVSDQDWQQFLSDIGAHLKRGEALRVLVKTDDAAPNS